MPGHALIDAIFLTVAAALILGALAKAADLLRGSPRTASQILLCSFLAALGLSFAAQSLSGRRLQDAIYANLGQLTGNTLTLVGASAALMMVLYILYPPREAARGVGLRLGALVVVLAIMSVLFVANPRPRNYFVASGPDIPSPPAGILAYYAVYLIYLAAAMTDLLIVTTRYVGHDPYLRTGLRIVAAGASTALVYTVGRACTLVLGLVLDLPDWIDFVVGVVLPSVAVLLIVIGATFSLWAPVLVTPIRWVRQELAYRRLGPLWQAAHDAWPDVTLGVDPGWRDAGMRLYRRIIEIQDAQLLIALHLPASVRESAIAAARREGLSGVALDATVDAAVYAVGLSVLDGDDRPSVASGFVSEVDRGEPVEVSAEGHGSLFAVARQLARISDALDSPLVRDFAKNNRDREHT